MLYDIHDHDLHYKISVCTPEVASYLDFMDSYGPLVTSVLKAFADLHELSSQDDLSVIAPVHPSGEPYAGQWPVGLSSTTQPQLCSYDLDPETDIHGPSSNKQDWTYLVSFGCAVMMQTYALDILALATQGRMTPSRLWHLAMQQGFEEAGHPYCIEGFPNALPGFTSDELEDLEKIGDIEVLQQRLVHEGFFWLWMAPDRFPVSPTNLEAPLPVLPEIQPGGNRTVIEGLPLEILIHIISSLPLVSLLSLASASQSLRTGILGNDYLACVWLYNKAPWWIPVPTQTPRKDDSLTTEPLTYLASRWSVQIPTTVSFPASLGWAYIRRCVRSGSMRNRRRIWNAALDIERVADLAGV
ncbi:hypothetical protein V8E55_007466 [Tylopilus felleus]